MAEPLLLVVMGVSASGKSTLARRLAERLGLPFIEGDTCHPPENIAWMEAGHPLDDEMRKPFLKAVGEALRTGRKDGTGACVAASVLKRAYRDQVRQAAGSHVTFVHLAPDADTLRERISGRTGHFMPPSLLDSQLATLEPLEPDEGGLTLSDLAPAEAHVETTLDWLRASGSEIPQD
ncbi:gluconokinase [Tropicimonas sp. IMCC34011]|uniref:gluconokinase n=1 Tax=Tropicimonas sp. IMCC34011 TaxID=2248759 RepID=UPI000E269AC5|nr:gluconokinase [Tropicimonas sp. IMCC34011]